MNYFIQKGNQNCPMCHTGLKPVKADFENGRRPTTAWIACPGCLMEKAFIVREDRVKFFIAPGEERHYCKVGRG